MHATPNSNDLKRSALDLLGSGNSISSVADLLRIPIDRVTAWQQEGPDAEGSNASMGGAAESVEGRAHLRPRNVRIEPTAFIPQRPITRAILIGLPLFLFVLAFGSNLVVTFRQLDLLWLYWLVLPVGLAMGAASMAYGLRSGFQFTAHSIVFHNAIGTRQLAYADIDCYSLIKNPQLGAYVLKLTARPGADDMQIWLEPSQVRGDIARWLASMRCTAFAAASFHHGNDPERVKEEWCDLLRPREGNSAGE